MTLREFNGWVDEIATVSQLESGETSHSRPITKDANRYFDKLIKKNKAKKRNA